MPLSPPRDVLTNTPIYRIIHVENLHVYLDRDRLHAPNHMPDDGLEWRGIEDQKVQANRYTAALAKGPGGTILDYISFYFGPRSPMLLRLATHREVDYGGPQEDIIYLASTAQEMVRRRRRCVFSDGHGLARFTRWFEDLSDLNKLDWPVIYAEWWNDCPDDGDRQRRKQAEFLVHKSCGWDCVLEIGVRGPRAKTAVEQILAEYPNAGTPPVNLRTDWYY